MRKAKADSVGQPFQLDLFQTVVTKNYSNSVELYQTLPDVFIGKQDTLRNADGTLPVLSRHGMYHKTSYTLDITPANITVIDPETGIKKKRAFYKTVVTNFIESALHKLSISDGFFLNGEENNANEYGLITTYYQICEELIRMGKNYSYEQIKEGISILAGLRYEIS